MFLFEYVGNATITVAISDVRSDHANKVRITYSIKLPYVAGSESASESGRLVMADDIHVVRQMTDNLTRHSGYVALLSFLSASAEAYGREDSENADLFPPDVMEWAYQYSDEIESEHLELTEIMNGEVPA